MCGTAVANQTRSGHIAIGGDNKASARPHTRRRDLYNNWSFSEGPVGCEQVWWGVNLSIEMIDLAGAAKATTANKNSCVCEKQTERMIRPDD